MDTKVYRSSWHKFEVVILNKLSNVFQHAITSWLLFKTSPKIEAFPSPQLTFVYNP